MFDLLWQAHWRVSKAQQYRGFHARLREIREEKRLSPPAWRARQIERLQAILCSASRSVEYYGKVFARVGFRPEAGDPRAGLVNVPLLTKDVIRQRTSNLLSKQTKRSRLLPNATGGSTGVPLNFFQDSSYLTISMALAAHVPEWWGIRPHDKIASVWGADQDLSDLSLRARLYTWRTRTRVLNAFRMSKSDLASYAAMLQQWKPPYMKGYSTALEALARHFVSVGRRPPRFTAICSSAEMLWPQQRQLIEETFASPVFDSYGSREISYLAAECPEERRLHQVSTWRYLEIVDENGHPVPEGRPGYIAVTDSSNYSMPFIRYFNGDMARFDPRPCPCGRPSPVLDQLLGRSTDMIRTREGELVHGEFFTHLFYGMNDVSQFQVHQTSLDHLILRYVPADASQEPSLAGVVTKIQDRMGGGVQIETQACAEIPVLPSGKRRFTVSDLAGFGRPK